MGSAAYLILEDGTLLKGESVGSRREVISEIVFNTSMTGYLEVLTDPSYAGQAVVMTYPLIGNYGVSFEDMESSRPWLSAFIAREHFGVMDEAILRAVACHSTLRAQASPLDMALFLSDKIAWDQPGEPPYLSGLMEALTVSLPAACRYYMEYTVSSGRLLCPHTDWTEALAWLRCKAD